MAEDLELMQGIRNREARALEALFARYSAQVLALCERILRDLGEAEEVLEEVFWEVWSRYERFDAERGTPVSYLLLLARSRALDRLRARNRRQARIIEVGGTDTLESLMRVPVTGDSPYDALALRERKLRIDKALRGLSDEQRELIGLSFFDGLTHAEIAARSRLPLGTVKTRIRRGLLVLRRNLLKKEGQA